MGTIGSKVEVVEDCTTTTPIKSCLPQRQLDVDPRSPTANIPRTPIMVDKTPIGLLDPRSPTPGIWRTPINNFLKKDENKVKEDVKPLLAEGPADLDLHETPNEKDLQDTPNEDDPQETHSDLDLPEKSPVSEGDMFTELEEKREALGALTDLQHLSLSDVDESSTLLEAKSKPVSQKKTKVQQKTQPKKLFYDKKRPTKPLSATPKSVLSSMTPPRSPLSTVVIDTNSPRVIMQRKQTKKIDAARQCRLDANRPAQDKENVDM